MENEGAAWVAELGAALGPRLVSVFVYGSHATDRPHPRDRMRICVELDPCDADALRLAGGVLGGPTRRGRLQPYFVARGELTRLGDVFPLRIHAMQAHRRMLFGPDPLEAVRVGREPLRIGVEQGLRNHLVRLRAQLALHDGDPLARAAVLGAIAEGIGDEVDGLAALGVPFDPVVPGRLAALRDGAEAEESWFVDTLTWLAHVVAQVDAMEHA